MCVMEQSAGITGRQVNRHHCLRTSGRTSGDVSMARSTVRRNGLEERSGGAMIVGMESSMLTLQFRNPDRSIVIKKACAIVPGDCGMFCIVRKKLSSGWFTGNSNLTNERRSSLFAGRRILGVAQQRATLRFDSWRTSHPDHRGLSSGF
jgi:hypothetical protein